MYIGATSHIILDDVPVCDVLRMMADAGFEGGELALRHLRAMLEAESPEAEAEAFRAAAEQAGLRIPQVHLSVAEMGSLDEEKLSADFALMEREIEISALAGVKIGVLHPTGGLPATLDEYRSVKQARIDSFARACEIAAAHDLAIAIENTYDPYGDEMSCIGRRRFGAIIPELHEVIDAVGADNFGICIDTGHTNLFGLPLGEAFRQTGDRLIATHVHDNHGSRDEHIEPMRGTIDWEDGIAALHEIGWDGIFNLEIGPAQGQPLDVQMLRMKHVVEMARWLTGR